MSLNNKLNAKRDSFGDRICDDLCEVLLSGLSLEDKIRHECVSKQFQRCVYRRQYILDAPDLYCRPENKCRRRYVNSMLYCAYFNSYTSNMLLDIKHNLI